MKKSRSAKGNHTSRHPKVEVQEKGIRTAALAAGFALGAMTGSANAQTSLPVAHGIQRSLPNDAQMTPEYRGVMQYLRAFARSEGVDPRTIRNAGDAPMKLMRYVLTALEQNREDALQKDQDEAAARFQRLIRFTQTLIRFKRAEMRGERIAETRTDELNARPIRQFRKTHEEEWGDRLRSGLTATNHYLLGNAEKRSLVDFLKQYNMRYIASGSWGAIFDLPGKNQIAKVFTLTDHGYIQFYQFATSLRGTPFEKYVPRFFGRPYRIPKTSLGVVRMEKLHETDSGHVDFEMKHNDEFKAFMQKVYAWANKNGLDLDIKPDNFMKRSNNTLVAIDPFFDEPDEGTIFDFKGNVLHSFESAQAPIQESVEPTPIKSVNNSGSFNPNSPRIHESTAMKTARHVKKKPNVLEPVGAPHYPVGELVGETELEETMGVGGIAMTAAPIGKRKLKEDDVMQNDAEIHRAVMNFLVDAGTTVVRMHQENLKDRKRRKEIHDIEKAQMIARMTPHRWAEEVFERHVGTKQRKFYDFMRKSIDNSIPLKDAFQQWAILGKSEKPAKKSIKTELDYGDMQPRRRQLAAFDDMKAAIPGLNECGCDSDMEAQVFTTSGQFTPPSGGALELVQVMGAGPGSVGYGTSQGYAASQGSFRDWLYDIDTRLNELGQHGGITREQIQSLAREFSNTFADGSVEAIKFAQDGIRKRVDLLGYPMGPLTEDSVLDLYDFIVSFIDGSRERMTARAHSPDEAKKAILRRAYRLYGSGDVKGAELVNEAAKTAPPWYNGPSWGTPLEDTFERAASYMHMKFRKYYTTSEKIDQKTGRITQYGVVNTGTHAAPPQGRDHIDPNTFYVQVRLVLPKTNNTVQFKNYYDPVRFANMMKEIGYPVKPFIARKVYRDMEHIPDAQYALILFGYKYIPDRIGKMKTGVKSFFGKITGRSAQTNEAVRVNNVWRGRGVGWDQEPGRDFENPPSPEQQELERIEARKRVEQKRAARRAAAPDKQVLRSRQMEDQQNNQPISREWEYFISKFKEVQQAFNQPDIREIVPVTMVPNRVMLRLSSTYHYDDHERTVRGNDVRDLRNIFDRVGLNGGNNTLKVLNKKTHDFKQGRDETCFLQYTPEKFLQRIISRGKRKLGFDEDASYDPIQPRVVRGKQMWGIKPKGGNWYADEKGAMALFNTAEEARAFMQTHLVNEACWDGYEQFGMKQKGKKEVPNCIPKKTRTSEAEYQGREVTLNKPMRGDVKKFKVYVKNPEGNTVKVNFGDPDMKIKKSDPKRRKSFRARHNCDEPGPKHKARYWSCRKW